MLYINKIDPPYWFADLRNNTLQLLLYGEDLNIVDVQTTIPHTSIRIEGGLNNKTLILSISLKDSLIAGTYDINITSATGRVILPYEIKNKRSWNKQRKATISNEDVVYLLMPDRFAKEDLSEQNLQNGNDPNKRHGGKIRGIISNLSYLYDLGVTALWLTPVFKNSEYHGYSITDFYEIEPCLGFLEDYQSLVKQAHEHGIKIIMDVVFNHCSIKHPWLENPPLDNWFNGQEGQVIKKTNYKVTTIFDPYASKSDRDYTVKGWFTEEMPDLNIENDFVFKYLTQMTIWWIETTGIDAIRMDTYLYSDFEKMIEWQNIITKEYPGFSVIAETWVPEAAYTAKIQNEAYKRLNNDTSLIVMDFAFQKRIESCFDRVKFYDKEGQIYNHFVYDYLYNCPKETLAFLDNHDLPRWYSQIKNKAKLKQALAILLTVPRIPQIYYGTEFLFSSDGNGYGDGNYRIDAFEALLPPEKFVRYEIARYLKIILNWRKKSKAISIGTMKHFIPQDGVYVYFRSYKDEKVMILANCTSKTSAIDLSLYKEGIKDYNYGTDVISNKQIYLTNSTLTMKKNAIFILELQK